MYFLNMIVNHLNCPIVFLTELASNITEGRTASYVCWRWIITSPVVYITLRGSNKLGSGFQCLIIVFQPRTKQEIMAGVVKENNDNMDVLSLLGLFTRNFLQSYVTIFTSITNLKKNYSIRCWTLCHFVSVRSCRYGCGFSFMLFRGNNKIPS